MSANQAELLEKLNDKRISLQIRISALEGSLPQRADEEMAITKALEAAKRELVATVSEVAQARRAPMPKYGRKAQ